MTPTFATLCSGVEAPALAWKGLGYADEPVFVADNAGYPTAFLARRHPSAPNHGDITRMDGAPYRGRVNVLWASFPCQDFSEAGKRKGMDGARGVLTLAGIRLVDEIEPDVFCFENVTGLLNDDYNAFGQFLGALAGEFGPLNPPGDRWANAGYVLGPKRTLAWRVLDAQHFGVPQSRPRVYLVACPRGGADPRRVLFEQREEGDTLGECAAGEPDAVVATAPGAAPPAYRVAIRGRLIKGFYGQQIEQGDTVSNCLRTAGGGSSVGFVLAHDGERYDIRKLLPEECEALQGMPPGYTAIPGASTTARLSAIGNSLAIPVVRWLGRRVIRELSHVSEAG
jgi:DNA (cytosine-5)-methyltransferase 1